MDGFNIRNEGGLGGWMIVAMMVTFMRIARALLPHIKSFGPALRVVKGGKP